MNERYGTARSRPDLSNAVFLHEDALRDGGSIEIFVEISGEKCVLRLMRDFQSWTDGNLDRIEIRHFSGASSGKEIYDQEEILGYKQFLLKNRTRIKQTHLKALLGLSPMRNDLPTLESIFGKRDG